MTQDIDLHISKRLKDLLPSLTTEERKQLKANIEADGRVTDPILFWHDGKRSVVVDGMHRYPIAKSLGVPYMLEAIEIGDTHEEAELWILNRQLGRRNLLSPEAQRKLRGELYNRMKRKDGGHGDQRSGCQIDTPKTDTAQNIAEKAGVSAATVKRDGARVAALGKCTPAVQKGVGSGAFKATDAEVKTLSKLNPLLQDNIARDLRAGMAKTVTAVMKARKIKQPAGKKPAKKKLPKKLDRKAYYKQWEQAIGPVVRLVDKIADGVGEKGKPFHQAVLARLEDATEEMAEWMEVK